MSEDQPIDRLREFVLKHVRTISSEEPELAAQHGAVDVCFFYVTVVEKPSADELRSLIAAAPRGVFRDATPLDGDEYEYLGLGGWIGDQGQALMLMGMGALLGLWVLKTPYDLHPPGLDRDVARSQADLFMTVKATVQDTE